MNRDVFHNQLALLLGYERIVNCNFIKVTIDEVCCPEDPRVILRVNGMQNAITFNASEIAYPDNLKINNYNEIEIKKILDAVHQAYLDATTSKF